MDGDISASFRAWRGIGVRRAVVRHNRSVPRRPRRLRLKGQRRTSAVARLGRLVDPNVAPCADRGMDRIQGFSIRETVRLLPRNDAVRIAVLIVFHQACDDDTEPHPRLLP